MTKGFLLLFVLLSTLTACMAPLPLRYSEQCAAIGMVVAGVSFSSGSSTAVATNGQVFAVAHEDSDDQSLSCRPPMTTLEQCHMKAAVTSGLTRANYTPGGENFFLFVGYVAFVIPGLVLHIVFDIGRDDVDNGADKVFAREWRKCNSPVEGHDEP